MARRQKLTAPVLRQTWEGMTYERTEEQKEILCNPPFEHDSANAFVYDPSPDQRIPKEGAWVMITRQLPPIEGGIQEHVRVVRFFFVEHEKSADQFGFLPDGKYKVLCRTPWGDVHLWPYEYSVVPVETVLAMWQDKEIAFHATNVEAGRFNDVMFYARSRGIDVADAMAMALGTLKGPVGWFEPRSDLAEEAEAMEERVHRWKPMGTRKLKVKLKTPTRKGKP